MVPLAGWMSLLSADMVQWLCLVPHRRKRKANSHISCIKW